MPVQRINAGDRVALGENSVIRIGDKTLRVITGSVTENPEKRDVTDNGSGGYKENTRGALSLQIRAEGYIRAQDNPTSNAAIRGGLSLVAGELFSQRVQVWVDIVNAPDDKYVLSNFYVDELAQNIDGKGEGTYSITLSSDGVFYTPGRPEGGLAAQ